MPEWRSCSFWFWHCSVCLSVSPILSPYCFCRAWLTLWVAVMRRRAGPRLNDTLWQSKNYPELQRGNSHATKIGSRSSHDMKITLAAAVWLEMVWKVWYKLIWTGWAGELMSAVRIWSLSAWFLGTDSKDAGDLRGEEGRDKHSHMWSWK